MKTWCEVEPFDVLNLVISLNNPLRNPTLMISFFYRTKGSISLFLFLIAIDKVYYLIREGSSTLQIWLLNELYFSLLVILLMCPTKIINFRQVKGMMMMMFLVNSLSHYRQSSQH